MKPVMWILAAAVCAGSSSLTVRSVPVAAQQPLAFDVVSIKRTPPGTKGGGFQNPPGQFIARNYAIRSLIVLAYRIAGYQIGNLPAWTDDERYNIVARTPPGTYSSQQRAVMLQALLTDRFKLKTHKETRELPIYALVHTRTDKKLGPSLLPSTLNCDEVRARRAAAAAAPTSPEEMLECGFLPSSLPGGVRRLRAKGISLGDFTAMMENFVDRPVFDRTGLSGIFDVDLTFLPQTGGPALLNQTDAPFVFTALEEQLGLKLEPTTTPTDVLVIDSVERPSEN